MKGLTSICVAVGLSVTPLSFVFASSATDSDSTQPRNSPPGFNDAGQALDPIIDGFRAPARFPSPEHTEWSGTIMSQAMRDPAFFAALNIANRDFINLLDHVGAGGDHPPLTQLGLDTVPTLLGKPEALQAEVGDFCLRCHSPAGWLEGFSEPATVDDPLRKGDFWGASMLDVAPDSAQDPDPLWNKPSEGHMDGVTCDSCHRMIDNNKVPGSDKSAGNGGMFMSRHEPFTDEGTMPDVTHPFQMESELCGTCHEVTNPYLKTLTDPDGDGVPVDVPHPIERTYTEWFNSSFPNRKEGDCIDCHSPMRFQGAQTWMLENLEKLWGPIDQVWSDLGYNVPASRQSALEERAADNRDFVDDRTAKLTFTSKPGKLSRGEQATVKIRIENLTGHKLPTGYGEGRQMWLQVRVYTKKNGTFFEDGMVDPETGAVIIDNPHDIFSMEAIAEGFGDLFDDNGDGVVSGKENHYHFALLNKIVKDNRIPPAGYDKAAYMAEGAFIVPEDEYADGQNWAEREYTFTVPANARGNIKIEARLLYKTFSNDFVDFLAEKDKEPTVSKGGHARDLPTAGSMMTDHQYWGEALKELYEVSGNGPEIQFARLKGEIQLKR